MPAPVIPNTLLNILRANVNAAFQAVWAAFVSQDAMAWPTTGTSTAYVLTPSPALAAYANNVRYHATIHTDSGANPTMNISGLGAKNLKQYDSTGAKVAPPLLKSGQKLDLVYDGTDLVILDPLPPSVSAGTGRLIGYQVFSASGTSSYTKGTNNPSFVVVEVQGAGGSGAVATSTSGPRLATGGGAGGYSLKKISAASLSASETVTVGSGGAAVSGGQSNGNNGGTSSFGSHCSATGGAAGTYTGSGSIKGALGGSATGGDVNVSGGGTSAMATSGTEFQASCGGASRFGGGGAGIASTSDTTQTGIAGGIGAGGGGNAEKASTGGHSSGKGGDGLVIVWEYA